MQTEKTDESEETLKSNICNKKYVLNGSSISTNNYFSTNYLHLQYLKLNEKKNNFKSCIGFFFYVFIEN